MRWQRWFDPHLHAQQADRVLTRWSDAVLDVSDTKQACVLRRRQDSQGRRATGQGQRSSKGKISLIWELVTRKYTHRRLVGQQTGKNEEIVVFRTFIPTKVLNHADLFPPKAVSHLESSGFFNSCCLANGFPSTLAIKKNCDGNAARDHRPLPLFI